MRTFGWFLLLLPLLEIYLLIQVGSKIGATSMMLWILASIVAGVLCIRLAGLATALSVRERIAKGEMPDAEMLTGVLWVIGGILLIIPGLITDFAGLVCILPLTRIWLIKRMRGGLQKPSGTGAFHQHGSSSTHDEPNVIEGEFQRKDDQ